MPSEDEQLREKIHEARTESGKTDAKLWESLLRNAEQIAHKAGFTELTGMDALCRLFVEKYGWLPEQTKRLTSDEVNLLLSGVDAQEFVRSPRS